MPIDHRDKVIRLWTLRQAWPRSMSRDDRKQPTWQEIDTISPFPKNLKFGRPRTIDRTGIT